VSKGGRCVVLTNLPPSCADCIEIWESQPHGNLRAGVGNLRNACQAWHVERFSMARWVNWNTVIIIS